MDDILNKLITKNIHNILIFSDKNYFVNNNIEIEQIGRHKDNNVINFINIDDFLNKKKIPIYYKYNCVFVDIEYLIYLKDIKYYFDDKGLFIMIAEKDFELNNNVEIFSILENKSYNVTLIEYNNIVIIQAIK
ncbi:MAG: hypothetical protein LBR40_05700 [Bacilli bacterium]|jgi:hypothetical protein|nr:hypothetical protein [Bacilli bacterium]